MAWAGRIVKDTENQPVPRHAALAVNLAGSMASFLIETWEARRG